MTKKKNTDVQDAPVDMTVTQKDSTVVTPSNDGGNVIEDGTVIETTPTQQEPGNVEKDTRNAAREEGKISQLETDNAQYRSTFGAIVQDPETYHKVLTLRGYTAEEASVEVKKVHPNYGSGAKSSPKTTKKQNVEIDDNYIDRKLDERVRARAFNQEIKSFDTRHADLDAQTREDVLMLTALNERRGMTIEKAMQVAELKLLTEDQLKEAELSGRLKQAAAVKATAAGVSGSVAKTGSGGQQEYTKTDDDTRTIREFGMDPETQKVFLAKQAARLAKEARK